MASLPDVRRVTTLTPVQFAEATAVLARAHFDHPHIAAVFPDPARRITAAQALFGAALRDGLRHGIVVIALDDKVAGVTIIYPPGAYPPTIARRLRVLPDVMRVAALSPAGLLRVARTMSVLDGLRPKEPHFYGFCIGIEPGRQSTGLGHVLSRALHDEADRQRLPIYLETQKRSTMEWVRRYGFEILREGIEMFPGGPPTWTMWRPGARQAIPVTKDKDGESPRSLPAIRRATTLTPVQFADTTTMLARTFFDHPYFAAVFSDPARRLSAARALFGAALKDGLRHGIVFLAVEEDKVAGVLVIYPPGAYPPTIARKLRVLPDLVRVGALSPAGLLRIGRTMRVLDGLRPKKPHYYGLCMGIAPGRQIAGIGTVLLKAMHDEADREGQPIYAETQKDHVLKWVRDYGFEVVREGIEMFPGGPRTWTLWRPARAAGNPCDPISAA